MVSNWNIPVSALLAMPATEAAAMAAAAAAIVMAPAAAMMAMAATERAEATAKSAEEEELGGELGIVLAYPAYICCFQARTRRAFP